MSVNVAYNSLMSWIARERFLGYDPYDAMLTRHRWLRSSRNLRIAQTYLHKFSPLNLRPLFGVPRALDNQGAALIITAAHTYPSVHVTEHDLSKLTAHLLSQSLVGKYGFHCWNGHPFAVQMRREYQTPDVPGVIGTEAVGNALMARLRADPSATELETVILSIRKFFLDVLFTQQGGAAFFRYKPITAAHSCTYNASVVAAGFVARVNHLFGLSDVDDKVSRAFAYVIDQQNSDGSWYYSIDLRSGKAKKQIDYHQGYILDALQVYARSADADVGSAYERGLRFYMTRQFEPDGRALYRYPRRWPVNIQDQAQGIITLTLAGRTDPAAAEAAARVYDWTIDNMRDDEGYFWYHRYPALVNRIPYMRWSNASMALALATMMRTASR